MMCSYKQKTIFRDRIDAGRQLAALLSDYRDKDVVVFAIPRGGIPVAMEVSMTIKAALDIVIVRKIPIPHEPEAGYGAVTEDGTIVLNESILKYLRLTKTDIKSHADTVRREIMRRSLLYRGKLPPSPVKGKVAIVIDDGLASGYTMLAAIDSLRRRKASRVVVAVPVASGSAFDLVKPRADDIMAVKVSRIGSFAVASYYEEWSDLTDDDIIHYLERWRATDQSPPRNSSKLAANN